MTGKEFIEGLDVALAVVIMSAFIIMPVMTGLY
jgi:hypothetical protein